MSLTLKKKTTNTRIGMNMKTELIQGAIFDMDGTLWDSSENVAASWSETIRSSGDPLLRNKTITGSDLRSVMGMTMVEIAAKLFPELTETRRIDILEKCGENEKNYLAANGGELYPQLEETLSALSKNHRLFIVSNCQNGYIEAFFEYYSLERYFTDYLCWGDTHKPKRDFEAHYAEKSLHKRRLCGRYPRGF